MMFIVRGRKLEQIYFCQTYIPYTKASDRGLFVSSLHERESGELEVDDELCI